MKMFKEVKRFFIETAKKNKKDPSRNAEERELLKTKVIKGTDFAVREYGEVFKKLAEYDRTLN
jgi:hypothetical protein